MMALSDLIEKEEGFVCYLRFRNSISASGVVVTYSNPFSISCVASFVFSAVLQVYSSFVMWKIADSRLM